jgi:hypothetical protein
MQEKLKELKNKSTEEITSVLSKMSHNSEIFDYGVKTDAIMIKETKDSEFIKIQRIQ